VAEGDYVHLAVSDTGSGMPQEIQAKVFDPFFTTKSKGHGLGLTVVHGIVRNLHGTIHITSEAGKGTTLQIWLPCAEAPVGAAAGPLTRGEEQAHQSPEGTVLFVEDESPLRQAVARMLRKRGFEVLEAGDGSTAIEVLRASGDRIAVILLDMTIPGLGSHAVITEAARARPGLKVILTSAYSEEMVTATTSTPLIGGFIRKPFVLGDLVQMLQNVLSS
jgi:CheY-like chemotaxis protein